MAKIITLLILFKFISALEVVPSKHQLEYFNTKYLRFMKITFLKRSRHSPYYVSLELDSYVGVGNNLTLKMALLEELSAGHYQPTPILGEYKLCDFLYKEPFFGQMYAKQLPANWTCPFPPGEYHFNNLVIHLENFPFRLPFTWSDVIVRTRVDVQGVLTSTNEEVFRWKTYVTVTQKLKKTGGDTKKYEKKSNIINYKS